MKTKLPLGISVAALAILVVTTGLVRQAKSNNAAAQSEHKVLFYQDSMHPWVKSDHPAKCTICAMDLTPIYEGQKAFGAGQNLVVLNSNAITVLNNHDANIQRLVPENISMIGSAGMVEENILLTHGHHDAFRKLFSCG